MLTKKSLGYVSLLGLFVLTACRQEPMIHLNEQNQAIVQQKIQDKTKAGQTPQDELVFAGGGGSSQEDVRVHWVEADGESVYNFDYYTLFKPYQLKVFTCGSQSYSTYVTYGDEDSKNIQIQKRDQDGKTETLLYQLKATSYEEIYQSDKINPYDNIIGTSLSQSQGHVKTLLKPPLQVDTQWDYTEQAQSTITKLYAEVPLESGTYEEVIEVFTELPNEEIRIDYYAPEVGLLAYWYGRSDGSGEWWELSALYEDVAFTQQIAAYQPTLANELEKVEKEFVWETNDSLASAFQELFRSLGLIDTTIEILDVYVSTNNVAVVDFTPGVVAVLNQGTYSEEAAIQAIVQTVADFFDVSSVRLTVSGNNMLPNSTPYPEGGLYTP